MDMFVNPEDLFSHDTAHLLHDIIMFSCVVFRLGIPEQALIPLSQADNDKGRELQSRPYMEHFPLWKREVL